MIRKKLAQLKRMVTLLLCMLLLTQSTVSVLAQSSLPPPAEWNFIQLTALSNNEVLSTASSITTIPRVSVNRPFNPTAERAELSFAMRYGQGARIEVFRLPGNVNPENIYQANAQGEFVGYIYGEFDGLPRVFDFGGLEKPVSHGALMIPNFGMISPGALAASPGDLGASGDDGFSGPSFLSMFDPASPGALSLISPSALSLASPSSLNVFAFRGYAGWLPELLAYDPWGLADPGWVPAPDNFINSILWDGVIVDSNGQHVLLTSGNYVIVVQPVAHSQSENRILLPIVIDHDYIPIITGLPRGNTTPFGAFIGIPGLHEINMISGNYFFSITDMTVPVSPRLAFTRNYNSQLAHVSGHLGNGWRTGFDFHLEETTFGATVTMPDGGTLHFRRCVEGNFTSAQGRDFTLENTNLGWTMTDRSRTRYYFYPEGNILGISPLNGEFVSFEYVSGQLTRVYNRSGSLTFTHIGDRIATVTATPGGRTISFEYDALGNLISVTDYSGRRTSYGYDGENRLISMTDTGGWRYLDLVYDSHSRLISARIGSSAVTNTIVYGVLHTITTDQRGHSKTYRFDRDRHITAIEHSDGAEFFAFENGRLVAETARNGRTIRYEHDERGNITRITGPEGGYSIFTFNENNLPTRIDRTNPAGVTTTRLYEYDERGNVISFTDEYGRVRRFTYDRYNRLISSTDAEGNTTEFEYDEYDRLSGITTPDGGTIRTEYDSRGNPIRVTSAMGYVTEFEYNAAGHLIRTTDPLGNTTRFEVDDRGNVTAVIDALGNRITTTFNAASQPLVITDALGYYTTHTYNSDGAITSTTFPDGGVIKYTYDMYGRLLSKTDPM
ncbi:MAG: DUF6531 domain-containing protein, partial [Defluviitaleaceae bacterium]|nr:DUF6531 domain-containing protein [Defluviitaleaceae bacterium]